MHSLIFTHYQIYVNFKNIGIYQFGKVQYYYLLTHTALPKNRSFGMEYIPPWSSPYIIGVAGLSGSGKTTVAQEIINSINEPWTVILSLDNFYKNLTPEQSKLAFQNEYDLDTPTAVDLDCVYECVKSIKLGKKTDIPVYSFAKHARLPNQKITIYGANVVIVEGIFALFKPELLDLMDCKIFVDTEIDICYSRRLLRDIIHRGRDINGVIKQWNLFVKPNAISYVLPTRSNADIVIPRGSDNKIAINLVIDHIKDKLNKKSIDHINHLKKLGKIKNNSNSFNQLEILPNTNQLKVIKSIMLNKFTSNDDFIFYFNRIASILISYSLDYVNYIANRTSIITPINSIVNPNDTLSLNDELIGISIIRSGDCFIHSLRKIIPNVKIGKLLIQTDVRSGEPKLHTKKLPILNSKQSILLFESQIISGTASIMAIKVLVDQNINHDKIILISYTATEIGLRRILNAFPDIKIVVACIGKMVDNSSLNLELDYEIDRNLDSDWWMNSTLIEERYFGTI